MRLLLILAATLAVAALSAPSVASASACKLDRDARFPAVSRVESHNMKCAHVNALVSGIRDGYESRSRLPGRVKVYDAATDRLLTFRCRYAQRDGSEGPYMRATCVRLRMRATMNLYA